MSDNEYPNVHARLRIARSGVGVPAQEDELEIWLKGTRFRVRDGHGRRYDELVGDVTEPRGLGVPARTMEDIMDRQSEAERRDGGSHRAASQLFGDRATDQGWVYPADGERWTTKARRLAPVAEQLLARDQAVDLPATGQGRVPPFAPGKFGPCVTPAKGSKAFSVPVMIRSSPVADDGHAEPDTIDGRSGPAPPLAKPRKQRPELRSIQRR